jgi:DNA polymerase-3 subunit gamma/tau
MRVLSRTWQMLLKGVAEVQAAGRPIAAAEMVLVRIAYVADLPTPDETIRALDDNGGGNGSARLSGNGGAAGVAAPAMATPRTDIPRMAPTAAVPPRYENARGSSLAMAAPAARPMQDAVAQSSVPTRAINGFAELVALAGEKRDVLTKLALERDVRPVRCEDGTLEIALEPGAAKTLLNDLSRKLQEWTGRSWMVAVSREQGAPTLKSVADARKAELETGVRADPLVRAVLERFPGAEIVGVRGPGDEAPPPPSPPPSEGDDEVPLPDSFGDNWVRDEEGE